MAEHNPYGITASAYLDAFRSVESQLNDKQRSILANHYAAPEHTATARQLALSVGYASHAPVNSQYGVLARRLCELLGQTLNPHVDILALASRSAGRELDLTLWSEVVSALDSLGWADAASPLPEGRREIMAAVAWEGQIRERLALDRHRDRRLRESALEEARRRSPDGRLRCQVPGCGFDFAAVYGPIGDGYMHVHHTRPVATYADGDETRLEDLAVVCANCHAMVHRYDACRELATLIVT